MMRLCMCARLPLRELHRTCACVVWRCVCSQLAAPTRRKTSRPWQADDYLNRVYSATMSFLKMVESSDVFLERFHDLVGRLGEDNPTPASAGSIRSVKAAKHRFESSQKPLARFCLYVDAFLTLACEIMRLRQNKAEAQRAETFIVGLDSEFLLTIALLADAGDESTIHLRFFDTESYDAAKIGRTCEEFRHRIDYLFVQEHVKQIGFTKHMLAYLRKPRCFFLPRKELKSVGSVDGVTPETWRHAISRMQNWVVLALEVLAAEFPDWQVLYSMEIFDLGKYRQGREHDVNDRHVRRLARAIDVDAGKLKSQFADFLPQALGLKRSSKSLSNLEAWRSAIFRQFTSKSSKLRHPQDVLARLFCRYAAWCGCTTSGIEQLLSKVKTWLVSKRRNKMLPQTEEDNVKVVCEDLEKYNLNELVEECQEIWANHYGTPRISGTKSRWISKKRTRPDPQQCKHVCSLM